MAVNVGREADLRLLRPKTENLKFPRHKNESSQYLTYLQVVGFNHH